MADTLDAVSELRDTYVEATIYEPVVLIILDANTLEEVLALGTLSHQAGLRVDFEGALINGIPAILLTGFALVAELRKRRARLVITDSAGVEIDLEGIGVGALRVALLACCLQDFSISLVIAIDIAQTVLTGVRALTVVEIASAQSNNSYSGPGNELQAECALLSENARSHESCVVVRPFYFTVTTPWVYFILVDLKKQDLASTCCFLFEDKH